jgi:hypothetical protein
MERLEVVAKLYPTIEKKKESLRGGVSRSVGWRKVIFTAKVYTQKRTKHKL